MIYVDISHTDSLEIRSKTPDYRDGNFDVFREVMHANGAKWNKDRVCWTLSLAKLNKLIDSLEEASFVDLNLHVQVGLKEKFEAFKKGLAEFHPSKKRVFWNQDLLNYPPMNGKHPNENFQRDTILRACNGNRFLFNWTMGLGKSYCIAAIIAHLRHYKLANKTLIFSLSIGVPNLADELEKFLKESVKIKVINSVAGLKDRNIFKDAEEDIILISYNAFRGITEYYLNQSAIDEKNETLDEAADDISWAKEQLKELKAEHKAIWNFLEATKKGFEKKEAKLKKKLGVDFITLKDDYKFYQQRKRFQRFCEGVYDENDKEIFKGFERELEEDYEYYECQYEGQINQATLAKAKATSSVQKKWPKQRKQKAFDKAFQELKNWIGDEPGLLICDECHAMSNPDAKWSEAITYAAPLFEYRELLSGTLADKHEKLYQPARILDRSLVFGYTYKEWLATYNDMDNKWGYNAINKNGWDLEGIRKLNQEMSRMADKKTMEECLDLPEEFVIPPIRIEMSKKHREIYEMFVNYQYLCQQIYSNGKGVKTQDLIAARDLNIFAFWQLAVDNPTLFKSTERFAEFPEILKKKIESFDYSKDFAKLDVVDDIIEKHVDLQDEKGIIWCYHPKTIECLKEKYKKYKPYVIDGSIAIADRKKYCDRFQADPKARILIASIPLINMSVSLTALKWQVYVECTYDTTQYVQSRGRLRRANSTLPVTTYHIRYKNSVDFLQEQILNKKQGIINLTLDVKKLLLGEIEANPSKAIKKAAVSELKKASEDGTEVLRERDFKREDWLEEIFAKDVD